MTSKFVQIANFIMGVYDNVQQDKNKTLKFLEENKILISYQIDSKKLEQFANLIVDIYAISRFKKNKVLKLIEENIDFLNVVEKSEKKSQKNETGNFLKVEQDFSKIFGQDVPENLEKLKLTQYQKMIIAAIIKNKNKASLREIENEFEKIGVPVNTGSMIGGSIAGITKKCEANKFPKIFKISSTGRYSICKEILEKVDSYMKVNN